jgi:hypothetical protein
MIDRRQNAVLNELLINLGRSLLQYVYEAWPWVSSESEAARNEVYALAERQAEAVNRLADFLTLRNWPIDFGIYPAEFTDLHYVSLTYLMGLVTRNADELVTEIHESRRLIDDPDAASLVSGVEQEQQFIANRLRELTLPSDQVKTA